jgi:mannose-6-phosphate isomerase-like protein (cupin superfamily)
MGDVKISRIGDIPPYQGPHAIPGIRFRPAGREIGVSAWGMNVLEIDAGCMSYPEHDHAKDGQEEVYVVLEGDGSLEAGGARTALSRGALVRVGPSTKRKFTPGPRGLALLVIGGTPGKAYAPK